MYNQQAIQAANLVDNLDELIKLLPQDSDVLSLTALVSRLIKKLKLPGFLQGAETSMLIFQFIMAFFKVNVWVWAGNTFENDPNKNSKVATVFAAFIGLIPPLLNYAHRYLVGSHFNGIEAGQKIVKNIITLEAVVLAFYSGASFAREQESLNLALQESIQTAAFLVASEKIIPTILTCGSNFIVRTVSLTKRLLNNIRQQASPNELPFHIADDERSRLLAQPINSSQAIAVHSAPINQDMKKIVEVITKYRSIPYQFLFLLVCLFMLLSFYKPFSSVLIEWGMTDTFKQGNFLGSIAIILSIIIANLEAQLL